MTKHSLWFDLVGFTALGAVGATLGVSGCGGASTPAPTPPDPGALIKVSMKSQVGVVLDEIPEGKRAEVAASLQGKPEAFWLSRAAAQVNMAKYRLAYRPSYYPDDKKLQLPLPPFAKWKLTLTPDASGSTAPRRIKLSGHDVVVVDYAFDSTLLTSLDSPPRAEPALAAAGGTWDEPFIAPVDPELLFQRTGYACMDEIGFPPNSVDSEETAVFYDQECVTQGEVSLTACHQTVLTAHSCLDAVDAKVGKVTTKIHFERVAWDRALADEARHGDVTSETTADISVGEDSPLFPAPKVVYRYVPAGDCTIEEQCVGGEGWRRLLQFSSINWNKGGAALDIGAVDYLSTGVLNSELAKHNVYEYSACHKHFHFMHYGSFTLGDATPANSKRGFCLQSTDRLSNNEHAPLDNPYADCSYQGIEAGWGDNYNAGIDCQWIDVTLADASSPVKGTLKETFNPDGFLCEGTPVLDAKGARLYEPTEYKTQKGQPVDRPRCDFNAKWSGNNAKSDDISLPARGEGFVTQPCNRGQIGPLRNCGFKKQSDLETCTPGAAVTLRCAVPAGSAPQTVRFCESSAALKSGTACTYGSPKEEGTSIGTSVAIFNGIVTDEGVNVTFTCPAARGTTEPGGLYSIYASPLVDEDMPQTVTCAAAP